MPKLIVVRRPVLLVTLVLALLLVLFPPSSAVPATWASNPQDAAEVEQLALALAATLRGIPVRDGAFDDPARYCPQDQLAVSWAPPSGAFQYGGYIAPLGPAPGPNTTSVNGVVVCRGANYAYMGFSAQLTADGWQVESVPVLGVEAGTETPPTSSRAPLVFDALSLPSSTSGPIDQLAPYQPQTTCDPTPKPGVLGFVDIVLAAYPATYSLGISRDCSIGGTSEHKEGRAWDWAVHVSNPSEAAAAAEVIAWLLSPDEAGHPFAMARRLGVMYIIYDQQIWCSCAIRQGWRHYVGASPHTDHVHFSFSWEGSQQQTSHWDGSPVHYRNRSGRDR